MRKLVIVMLLIVTAPIRTARADVGIGFFLGEPTGLDVKVGMGRKSGLDILLGVTGYRDGYRDLSYGHVTYLVTPFVGRGESVLVPLRLGIGGALYGQRDDIAFAVRAPLELALRFRTAPIELYGEVALALILARLGNEDRVDFQGGIGLRFYF